VGCSNPEAKLSSHRHGGQSPPVKLVDVNFTAGRSHGRLRYHAAVPHQFVIVSKKPASPGGGGGGLSPIGSRKQVVRDLSRYNTASEVENEDDILYGPGIRIELPPGQDPLTQMLLTVTEEEIAWLVIMRLAKQFEWKIVDTESGRELNA
jgi:hypothetical protein